MPTEAQEVMARGSYHLTAHFPQPSQRLRISHLMRQNLHLTKDTHFLISPNAHFPSLPGNYSMAVTQTHPDPPITHCCTA